MAEGPLPGSGPRLTELNPFAVELRYDLLEDAPGAGLDREAARALLVELRAWAESEIRQRDG